MRPTLFYPWEIVHYELRIMDNGSCLLLTTHSAPPPTPPTHHSSGTQRCVQWGHGISKRTGQVSVRSPDLTQSSQTLPRLPTLYTERGSTSRAVSWTFREKRTISSTLLEPSPTTDGSYPIEIRKDLPPLKTLRNLGAALVNCPHLRRRTRPPGS